MYEIHHKTYKRLGKERLTDFFPLCRTHHQMVHDEWKAYEGSVQSLWTKTNQVVKRERKRLESTTTPTVK